MPDPVTWCQFCPEPASAMLERRSDGKLIPVCSECRCLSHGCRLYWVKEVSWDKIRAVNPKRG